ncbi:MFS transporter [Embleya scabrispora]|uniref:MFS transporter n=1 Tax=Embleya scabrispora TaxID=159449 RepID=UPI000380D100|nr:MFS transporter [Embleya scabrispora]MYS87517.1 MFS transporter [Streptomyces sp. SID5474]
MRTYRELFRAPEYTPLFATSSAHLAATNVSGLALGTLVYDRTGSPLLAALGMFGGSLAQVLGATALMSAADRLPPRAAMTVIGLIFAAGTAALAIPGLPLWAVFAIVLGEGAVAAVGGGVRYGLLNEILPRDGFLLGRSVLNMSNGVLQIVGFSLGAVLVTVLSARGTLLVAAGLYLLAAIVARSGLARRAPRASGRPSVAETWRNNTVLWSVKPRRYTYLALWVPNGLIVGCESLFIPLVPDHAGLLFAFAALGMLAGDVVGGRFVPGPWRRRLGAPMLLLLATPYLLFAVHPPLPLALAVVAVASIGYSATLLFQERLMAMTPDELSGQALGLHSSGMVAMQGVGASIAGGIAQVTSPTTAITVLAGASITVTLTLAAGLRAHPGPVLREA